MPVVNVAVLMTTMMNITMDKMLMMTMTKIMIDMMVDDVQLVGV